MEHLWISQVLKPSLYTCHGFETPLTRHNLTNTAVLHGLQWRCKPRQSDLIFIGAIPALQGHVSPMAYVILCVRFTYLVHLIYLARTSEMRLQISSSATGATLDTGGWLNLT